MDYNVKALHDAARRIASLRERAAGFDRAAELIEGDDSAHRVVMLQVSSRLRRDAAAAREEAARIEQEVFRLEDPRLADARQRALSCL